MAGMTLFKPPHSFCIGRGKSGPAPARLAGFGFAARRFLDGFPPRFGRAVGVGAERLLEHQPRALRRARRRLHSEAPATSDLPLAQGQTFGTGPTRVALLLPLTGDPAVTAVGISMAHGAELAMDYIASNGSIADNITLVLKDTGTTPQGATAAAAQAVSEGASLILGPLRADQVTAAGGCARAAGVPVIGFSNNSGAAGPGVYLLNVLPESEVKRSMAYVQKLGKKAFAGIFPTTDFGRIQQGAFTQASSELGITVRAVYNFKTEDEARGLVAQLAPLLQQGAIDALFIPDRATAPSFADAVRGGRRAAGPDPDHRLGRLERRHQHREHALSRRRGLPAVDDAGYQALLPLYQQKFGGTDARFATIAYTATILANSSCAGAGHTQIRPHAAHGPRRLQRPRRRVPVPARRAEANTRW